MMTHSGTYSMKALALTVLLSSVACGRLAMAQEPAEEMDADAVADDEGTAAAETGQSMSVEELEKFLEKQRDQLELVRKNRKETEARAAKVRKAIDERQAELAKIESELESLCEDREAVREGSYDQCMTANRAGEAPVEDSMGKASDADEKPADDG